MNLFSLWSKKNKQLTSQEAIDGLLVLEKVLITMVQMPVGADAIKQRNSTIEKIEQKINTLLDII